MKNKSTATTSGDGTNINYTIHTPNQSSGAGAASRSILAMSKPAMMGVGFLALGTLAVGLFSAFRVPGLEEQIRDLEAEIDILESEIDELTVQNDRFEELNGELNDTLLELEELNDQLNETATKLKQEVDTLEEEVDQLEDTKNDLDKEKDTLTQLNQDLITTQQLLEVQLEDLERVNQTMTETNQNLTATTDALSAEVQQLEETNTVLTETTQALNDTVTDLRQQNDRLEEVVADLEVVQEYFNATSQDLSQQLSEVQTALDSSITQNRENTFSKLFNFYDDVRLQWDCRNQDFFADEAFYNPLQNHANSIVEQSGEQALNNLLSTIELRMMRYMCLDRENFSRFMTFTFDNTIPHEDALLLVTYDHVETTVTSYSDAALRYYGLPDCGVECEISPSVWETASFDCTNLDQPYRWSEPTV